MFMYGSFYYDFKMFCPEKRPKSIIKLALLNYLISCGFFKTRSVTFDFRFPALYFCGIRVSEYRLVTLATDKCPIFVRNNVTLDI